MGVPEVDESYPADTVDGNLVFCCGVDWKKNRLNGLFNFIY